MAIELGIDLGTANTLIYEKKKGIVLDEPSMVVRSRKTNQILAIGEEASEMMGRTPEGVQVLRPIRSGVINSYRGTVALLHNFFKTVAKSTLMPIRAVVCVPCSITEVERRAVTEAAKQAGAREVFLIESPLAGAIGCGIDISLPHGSMIVNVGAGLTEVAIISLGGIVASQSVRVAGSTFDSDIVQYIKKNYNISVGDATAEQIKCNIGTVYPGRERETMKISGRDLTTGLMKDITLTSSEMPEALDDSVEKIIDAINMALENTPPELASDVMESGIVLAGGGAQLKGLGKRILVSTDIPVYIAENPIECVAAGAGESLDFLKEMNAMKNRF